MTEEEYILINGGDCMIGQSIIYQSSHENSRTDAKVLDAFNKKLGRILDVNTKLREEFREKVASGEIHKDTIVEELVATANGHEDNEATWAARRCLRKLGIEL